MFMLYVAFVYNLSKVLNLPHVRNGKLVGPTHYDVTSANSIQYWYASKTN